MQIQNYGLQKEGHYCEKLMVYSRISLEAVIVFVSMVAEGSNHVQYDQFA